MAKKYFDSEQIKQGFSQFKTEADNAYVSQDSFDTDANIIELVDDIFIEYSIATSVTNGSYSGSTTIKKLNGTATVTISANEGYDLPSTITVNGVTGTSGSTDVTWSYNTTTGEISLSNAAGNVSISAVCESSEYQIQVNITLPSAARGSWTVVGGTPSTYYFNNGNSFTTLIETIKFSPRILENNLSIAFENPVLNGTISTTGSITARGSSWQTFSLSEWFTVSGNGTITINITSWD